MFFFFFILMEEKILFDFLSVYFQFPKVRTNGHVYRVYDLCCRISVMNRCNMIIMIINVFHVWF